MERIAYRIENSRSGMPTLIVENGPRETPLHSKIDPLRESIHGEIIDASKHDFVIVLGCGLGYGLQALTPCIRSLSRVVIIERLMGVRALIRDNPCTSFLAENKNVIFIEGENPAAIQEKLSQELQLDAIRGIRVIEHPQSLRVFPEYYAEIRDNISRLVQRKAGSASARRAFGSRYLRNGLINLRMIENFRSISDLFDSFRSMDAVVVTSGPGLEENLDHLREKQQGVLIIAADSALPVLSGAGIHADYVVAVDPQAYIYEHLAGLSSPHPDLVLSLTGYSGIARMPSWKGDDAALYLSLNSHPLCQVIDELFPGAVGNLDSRTGNVAGDAVLLAIRMKVRRVALVGFDFSFPRGRIYSRGTAYQRRYSSILNSRVRAPETSNMSYIRQGGTLREEDVLTRRSFLQYRGSLHDMVLREGSGNLFHVRQNGLSVAGIPEMRLADFLRDTGFSCEKYEQRRKVRGRDASLARKISGGRLKSFLMREDVLESLLDESLGKTRRNVRDAAYKELIRLLPEE